MPNSPKTITEEQMQDFAAKLVSWADGLDEVERAILQHMLENGASQKRKRAHTNDVIRRVGVAVGRDDLRRHAVEPFRFERFTEKLDRDYFRVMGW